MFKKVLIANRGEIACRIIRTLRKMGVGSVAVYSDPDATAAHVLQADEAVRVGPASAAESYLNVEAILDAARRTGAQAIHPGYGFLSENASFARLCAESGIEFIGPTPEAMPGLLNYFNAADVNELKAILDDDIYPVDVAYHHPPANHIACAFDWHVAHENESYTERSLTEAGFFARCNDIDRFPWPDPAEHIDVAECRENAERVPEGRIGLGILWSAHFQDVCAAFGMENALMQMLLEPEFFARVLERIVDFYLRANEIF